MTTQQNIVSRNRNRIKSQIHHALAVLDKHIEQRDDKLKIAKTLKTFLVFLMEEESKKGTVSPAYVEGKCVLINQYLHTLAKDYSIDSLTKALNTTKP